MANDKPTQTIEPFKFLTFEKYVVKKETIHKPIKYKWKPVPKPSMIVLTEINAKYRFPQHNA